MKPGKLNHDVLERMLSRLKGAKDPRVLVGPRVGEDAAVVALGNQRLVIATDPITFAADRIGWYAVQVNANDVATMGARPAWFQACILLPAEKPVRPDRIFADINTACEELDIAVTGGHTEVTSGVDQPVIIGTMMGAVSAKKLVMSSGLRAGDQIVMTGAAATEATAILAREFGDRVREKVPRRVLRSAARFLFDPGISIVRPALIAADCGATAMHDPTEGGVITGLWELAQASRKRIVVDTAAIPIRPETRLLSDLFGIDPLRAIASGSLLIGIRKPSATSLLDKLASRGIHAVRIGKCVSGPGDLLCVEGKRLRPQARDEIAKL